MATLKAIDDIAVIHAEEAAFLWVLRDGAVKAPHYDLNDLVKLDARIESHLDGLRVVGPTGWEVCQQELKWQEPGEVFLASILAFDPGMGDAQRTEEVLRIVGPSMELARGMISALGWLTYAQAASHIRTLIESDQPEHQWIGIAASTVHRKDPGPALIEAIHSSESMVRARALRTVGELGRHDLMPKVAQALQDEDEVVRFWAAWTLTLRGESSTIPVLCQFTEGDGLYGPRAAELAARRMKPTEAFAWQRRLAAQQTYLRVAIWVAAAIGDPVLVPWLLDLMKTQEHARLAGEAFTTITGVDLELNKLDTDAPEGLETGPTDDPADDNVDMDPDEDLPWPAVTLIEKWWSQNSGHFQIGTRYLIGRSIGDEGLSKTLRDGKQRHRMAAAIELALLRPDQAFFDIRERSDRQVAAMTKS